jgi:hypothetical protein
VSCCGFLYCAVDTSTNKVRYCKQVYVGELA